MQLEICFNTDWKIQTVSVSHFLDHYKMLLPTVATFKWSDNNILVTPKKLIISSPKSQISSEGPTTRVRI